MTSGNPNQLPLTVRESGETRLERMKVDPEFAKALRSMQPMTLAKLKANKETAGLDIKQAKVDLTFSEGFTLTNKLPLIFGPGKTYGSLDSKQRYFVMTLVTTLEQNDFNADVMPVGTKIGFDFDNGTFYINKSDETKPLQLQEFVAVKEKSIDQRKNLIEEILKAGGLYDAVERGGDNPTVEGRIAFIKARKDEFIRRFNEFITDKTQKLDAAKNNFGYRATAAQNAAYLKTYISFKKEDLFGEQSEPTPAEPAVQTVPDAPAEPAVAAAPTAPDVPDEPAVPDEPTGITPITPTQPEILTTPTQQVELEVTNIDELITSKIDQAKTALKEKISMTEEAFDVSAAPQQITFDTGAKTANLIVDFLRLDAVAMRTNITVSIDEGDINRLVNELTSRPDAMTPNQKDNVMQLWTLTKLTENWQNPVELTAEPTAEPVPEPTTEPVPEPSSTSAAVLPIVEASIEATQITPAIRERLDSDGSVISADLRKAVMKLVELLGYTEDQVKIRASFDPDGNTAHLTIGLKDAAEGSEPLWETDVILSEIDTTNYISGITDGPEVDFQGYETTIRQNISMQKFQETIQKAIAEREAAASDTAAMAAPTGIPADDGAPETQVTPKVAAPARPTRGVDESMATMRAWVEMDIALGDQYKREIDDYLTRGQIEEAYKRAVFVSGQTDKLLPQYVRYGNTIKNQIEKEYGNVIIKSDLPKRKRSLERSDGQVPLNEPQKKVLASATEIFKKEGFFEGFLPKGAYTVNGVKRMTAQGGNLQNYQTFEFNKEE